MVEVFKTNVCDRHHAEMLLHHIHAMFVHWQANFDLEDCDRILRVKPSSGTVQPKFLIELLRDFGFTAERLEDECPAGRSHDQPLPSWSRWYPLHANQNVK